MGGEGGGEELSLHPGIGQSLCSDGQTGGLGIGESHLNAIDLGGGENYLEGSYE